jgi:hypothetical protein
MYLSKKTKEKTSAAARKYCPKCHKAFRRLDTHLRNSAMCKDISPLPSPITSASTNVCVTPPQPCQDLTLGEDSMLSLQNINPAVRSPDDALVRFTQTTNTFHTPHHVPQVKEYIKLPRIPEGWEEADHYFSTTLVPAVIAEPVPQEKNRILVEGVYAFFASAYGTRQINLRKKRRRPLHNGSLKEVERKKKEAKKELKMAQQRGFSSEVVQSLAQQFFSLVRCHNRLKRSSNARLLMRNTRVARELCYKNLGRCAKEVLDGNSDHIPAFTEATAYKYFTDVYHSGPRNFVQPEWMPTPSLPDVEMDCSPFTPSEILRVIKRMKSGSAPSPFDRVGYVIFKKCPALIPALVHLFNICWAQAFIPHEWKTAAVKLIAKGSAAEDATNPGNFRPIALTPCISKIFTTLLRNRWLKYMLVNGYLDSSLQKAFMPTVPGCTEHHLKLSSIIAEAKSKHKSLAICWLI